jgi:two-component system, NtrC family, sensor kinase
MSPIGDSPEQEDVDLLLAAIHHELATPMAAVVLSLHTAVRQAAHAPADTPGLPELRASLDAAQEGCALAMTFLHELRTLRPGRAFDVGHASCAPIDANQVLRTALRMLGQPRSSALVRVDLGAVPLVRVRPARLLQLFVNLLRNAVEAVTSTPHTGAVRVRSHTGEGGTVRFEIADDGPGIDPEHLAHIFEPFYSTKRAHGGSGVGLTICRRLIDDMGGSLRLDSRPGVGTTVHLALPACPDSDGSTASGR